MDPKKSLLLGTLLLLTSSKLLAAEMSAGTIHFTGEIIEPSCEITGDGGTSDLNIPLGTYPSSYFDVVGKETTLMPVRFMLDNCPLKSDGLPAIQLTFTGTSDLTGDVTLLDVSQITTAGDAAATGVGIAVSPEGDDTNLLHLDGSEGQLSLDLPDIANDSVPVNLNARYKSFAQDVEPGAADADLVVNILYR
ncbi:fimbrial protein [Trabulsiella odontotermitis]|uniref:fimbrial protein n=1 Tax=Trabulsiella odontotermitis TaxID=379893 RepID=UPI003AC15D25